MPMHGIAGRQAGRGARKAAFCLLSGSADNRLTLWTLVKLHTYRRAINHGASLLSALSAIPVPLRFPVIEQRKQRSVQSGSVIKRLEQPVLSVIVQLFDGMGNEAAARRVFLFRPEAVDRQNHRDLSSRSLAAAKDARKEDGRQHDPHFQAKGRGTLFWPSSTLISLESLICLMPLAFFIHDGEEIATTYLTLRDYDSGGQLNTLFVGIVAVILLDGVKHVGVSLVSGKYSSGVITAAVVEIPYAAYTLYRLFDAAAADVHANNRPGRSAWAVMSR